MTFPSVTATMSPLAVLPQFVEVLGRKIDKISSEVDWVSKEKQIHMPTRKNEPLVRSHFSCRIDVCFTLSDGPILVCPGRTDWMVSRLLHQ